jgi:catechol 2,3-dioxygenase-like lactoylglutathione lyase family enzyme
MTIDVPKGNLFIGFFYRYCFQRSKPNLQMITQQGLSIRPFIGSKNFDISRKFYSDLGFEEVSLTPTLSVFKLGKLAFYLQDAYVKIWIENTMIFMEVDQLTVFYNELLALDLTNKYPEVKLSKIKEENWGRECFLHDPAGNLWHFGEFLF